MRNAAILALVATFVAACATTTARKPVAIATQPSPETAGPVRAPSEIYGIADPWGTPDVTANAPVGWAEGSTDDMPAGTVGAFIHPSGRARVFVALVPSGNELPAERVHSFIPAEYGEAVTTSIVSVSGADGSARLNWTAHPTKYREYGVQGSVLLKIVPGRPDLLLLVSGVWPQGETPQMTPGFTAVAQSVRVR